MQAIQNAFAFWAWLFSNAWEGVRTFYFAVFLDWPPPYDWRALEWAFGIAAVLHIVFFTILLDTKRRRRRAAARTTK
jgi:hypothetical protein